ncbi:MAG: MFS transporter, partial [Oceanospirillales bacterium]|nr:MFS transporter [Oceanospirillales bacterium]
MRLIIISLSALFISLMLMNAGNAFLLTYLGIRLGAEGVPPTQVGFVMVCYSIGFVIGSHWCTNLVAKVGHIRTFAALTSLTAMASISYPLLESVYFWAILRFVGGITAAGLFVIIESWFGAVANNNNRATLFALYQIAAYGASTSAQLTVGYTDPLSAVPFTGAGLVLLAAIIPLSLSRMQSPVIEQGAKMSLLSLYREAPLGLTCAFTAGILLGAYYALVPLFGSLTAMTVKQVSQLMTVSVLMAVLLAWPIGWICDRIQRSKVLLVVLLVAAMLSSAVSMTVEMAFTIRLFVTAVLLGLMSLVYSLGVALANDRIDSSARVAASSALMLSYGAGSIIGPISGSMLMEAFRPSAMFIGFATLLVA